MLNANQLFIILMKIIFGTLGLIISLPIVVVIFICVYIVKCHEILWENKTEENSLDR